MPRFLVASSVATTVLTAAFIGTRMTETSMGASGAVTIAHIIIPKIVRAACLLNDVTEDIAMALHSGQRNPTIFAFIPLEGHPSGEVPMGRT